MGSGVTVPAPSSSDIWTYVTRTLTRVTGTPRSDLVGADEAIYTRLDETLSGKLTFEDSIPATPSAGSFGEKFKKELVKNNVIYLDTFDQMRDGGILTLTDPGTSPKVISALYKMIEFDEADKVGKLGFVFAGAGTETGTKTIDLYNQTDTAVVASATWSGTGTAEVGSFASVTYTGVKRFWFRITASTPTEDINVYKAAIVLVILP